MHDSVVHAVTALVDPATRDAAAARLAESAGAEALVLLVRDIDVDAMVPAPGLAATLPGGDGWRDLLGRLDQSGLHRGEVAFPVADRLVPATALCAGGVALVFLGPAIDAATVQQIEPLVPLVGAMLRAEQREAVARGERLVALAQARQSQAVAVALDAARAELERTLRALEEQARALDEARHRAEDAARAKDEFLAMLGHELRNPLSPIVTAAQLLRLKGHASREMDIIERQVRGLTRLVDDLLDVSRLTRGKVELHRAHVMLDVVAQRAIEIASPLFERKRQRLALELPPGELHVHADPERLAQVLANLLTNASKYSDEGTTVTLAASRTAGPVRIAVRDQGVGIAPGNLERIFESFEQQPQAIDRSQGGLGLGLAIARNLVMLHGGTIHASSAGEGQGSEFVIELPDTPAPPVPRALPPARAPQPRLQRVLVVDDNDDAAQLVADALRAQGCTVATAQDGPAALSVAAQFGPEAVLLDIGLPVIDGYEVARLLRRTPGLADVRLVAVTGYGQASDRLRSEEAGFSAHLVKPVTLEALLSVLDADPRRGAGAGGEPRTHSTAG